MSQQRLFRQRDARGGGYRPSSQPQRTSSFPNSQAPRFSKHAAERKLRYDAINSFLKENRTHKGMIYSTQRDRGYDGLAYSPKIGTVHLQSLSETYGMRTFSAGDWIDMHVKVGKKDTSLFFSDRILGACIVSPVEAEISNGGVKMKVVLDLSQQQRIEDCDTHSRIEHPVFGPVSIELLMINKFQDFPKIIAIIRHDPSTMQNNPGACPVELESVVGSEPDEVARFETGAEAAHLEQLIKPPVVNNEVREEDSRASRDDDFSERGERSRRGGEVRESRPDPVFGETRIKRGVVVCSARSFALVWLGPMAKCAMFSGDISRFGISVSDSIEMEAQWTDTNGGQWMILDAPPPYRANEPLIEAREAKTESSVKTAQFFTTATIPEMVRFDPESLSYMKAVMVGEVSLRTAGSILVAFRGERSNKNWPADALLPGIKYRIWVEAELVRDSKKLPCGVEWKPKFIDDTGDFRYDQSIVGKKKGVDDYDDCASTCQSEDGSRRGFYPESTRSAPVNKNPTTTDYENLEWMVKKMLQMPDTCAALDRDDPKLLLNLRKWTGKFS